MLKINNTLGRKLQEFKPINPPKVSFYHCGPTVYWTQHIGNMRGMTMGDLIRRSLLYLGYDVKYVSNYTDFGHLTSDADEGEDKMAKGARREGISPKEVADKYIAEFERDVKLMNILAPTVRARATDYIDEMIKMVQELLDKGYAYATAEAIYFDTSKFPNYTELSGRDMTKDMVGAGHGEVKETSKRNPADFAVWFFRTGPHKNALQYWESPFESPEVEKGYGFPGWHLECSAMARVNLGQQLDIHMGGVEHISIHHTNEIAQSEAVNGKKYVNYWLHNEHLNVDNKKMAKSDGTGYVLQDVLDKDYDPMHLRYFFLQAHYRSKQNFTWEGLDAARNAYEKLIRTLSELPEDVGGVVSEEWRMKFLTSLENDFNVPDGLAVVWDVLKSDLSDEDKLTTILDFDEVLGLRLKETLKGSVVDVPENIQKLILERNSARDAKNWKKSDELRVEIEKQGFEVKDTDDGTQVRKAR